MSTLTIVLLIILLLVLSFSLIAIFVITIMQVYGAIVSAVPLVPVRRSALKSINEALAMGDGDVFYDLGSGDGRVLKSILDHYPRVRAVGLEIGPWPRLLSKLRLRKYGSRAEVHNQDFFKADLSKATHIFIYLYPSVLEKLEPVFDKKLTPGTHVVSCDFKFENKTADKVIIIPENKTLSKTLYVYNW